jgi:hypothetical protein
VGEASENQRAPRRRLLPIAIIVAGLVALGGGAVWAGSAIGDRPGAGIHVAPVIDGEPLETATPNPTPTPSVTPTPEPSPAPQPVAPPPPVDVDDDDDADDPDDDVDDTDN